MTYGIHSHKRIYNSCVGWVEQGETQLSRQCWVSLPLNANLQNYLVVLHQSGLIQSSGSLLEDKGDKLMEWTSGLSTGEGGSKTMIRLVS